MCLRIWDVGGQHTLRNMWQSYYSSCHAIVFVIDSADVGDGELEELRGSSEEEEEGRRFSSSPALNGRGREGTRGDDDVIDSDTVRNADEGGKSSSQARSLPRGRGRGDGGAGQGGGAGAGAEAGQGGGRLAECKLALETVLAAEDTLGVPVLVLANKQDREDCVETVKIKEGLVRKVFEGEKGGGIRDSRVLPVSALRGTGVQEAVDWLRSRVRWNKEGRPPGWR